MPQKRWRWLPRERLKMASERAPLHLSSEVLTMSSAMKTLTFVLLFAGLAAAGDTATVMVYREPIGMAGHFRMPLFVDGERAANLKGGHVARLTLPAGKHEFQSADRDQHLVLTLAPDSVTFVKVD